MKTIPDTFNGYTTSSKFFKMSHDEFYDYCAGKIAVSIFKGELSIELTSIINMSQARGMKQQWDNNK